jgi:hypothetical protein
MKKLILYLQLNSKGEKVIDNTVLSSEPINLSHLSSGIYILTLKTDTKTYFGKIIKD